MFQTTDSQLFPRISIYEILKKVQSKDCCNADCRERFPHLNWNECEKAEELCLLNRVYFSGDATCVVDFGEDSPATKVQFGKLEVTHHNGDLDVLPKLVPTDFEEISMHDSWLDRCFPLPATLKKLDLLCFRFGLWDSWEKIVSFIQKMTWEDLSVRDLTWSRSLDSSKKPLELTVVEAWRDADDPQLKHFQSGDLQEEKWHTFFAEIQHIGCRIDNNTMHIDHKYLSRTLCITIERRSADVLDTYKILHMRCL
uniref:FBA_2 domain-containing protein n=1 Tax=Steinernema glaseri TaxID=37863 RepID=A0A1I7Y4Q0_9BILA